MRNYHWLILSLLLLVGGGTGCTRYYAETWRRWQEGNATAAQADAQWAWANCVQAATKSGKEVIGACGAAPENTVTIKRAPDEKSLIGIEPTLPAIPFLD